MPQFAIRQLERHLEIFSREDHRLLLLLAPAALLETRELTEFRDRAMRAVLSLNDEGMSALLDDFEGFTLV